MARLGSARPLRRYRRKMPWYSSAPAQPNFTMTADGYAIPFWNSAGPTGVYSSRTGKLWVVEEGSYNSGTPTRRYHVRTRDMNTGVISPVCFVANVPAAADYHGPAAMVELPAPATGFFLIVGGDHDGGGPVGFQQYVNQVADEPMGWRTLTPIGLSMSYPHLAVVGSNVWAINRSDEGGLSDGLQYRRTTAIAADGTPTWSSAQSLLNPTSGRIYLGVPKVHPVNTNEIHLVWVRADVGDTIRYDVYYGILDVTTPTAPVFKNFDGSVSTAVASMPLSDATMDASYRIFNINEGIGENSAIPAVHWDAANAVHLVWSQGVVPNLTAKHSIWNGSAWVTTDVGTIKTKTGPVGIQNSGTGVLVTYSANGDVKGEVHGKIRSSGGVWGNDLTLWQGTRQYGTGGHSPIYPAHADAGQGFAEIAVDVVNDYAGDLQTRILKGDGTWLPWVATGYTYVNAETQAYDDARSVKLAALHLSAPYYVDRLMSVLKSIGLAKFESYYCLGLSAVDNDDWLIDLVSPSRKLVRNTTPTFVPYKGLQGDGVNVMLQAPENLNTSSKYTQNSAHLGVITLTTGRNGNAAIGASGGGHQAYIQPSTGTNFSGRINSGSGSANQASTNTARSAVVRRNGAATFALFGEGVNVNANTTASTGVPAAPVLLNSISGGAQGDHLVFAAHWGASLTDAEVALLYWAVQLPLRRLLAS